MLLRLSLWGSRAICPLGTALDDSTDYSPLLNNIHEEKSKSPGTGG